MVTVSVTLGLVEDSKAKVVLTQQPLMEKLTGYEGELLILDISNIDLSSYKTSNLKFQGKPTDLVYVIYTSGSTGKPKGVMTSHEGFSHYIQWASEYYSCDKGSGSPVHSSLGFDLTLTGLFTPLVNGKTVYMIPDELGVEGLLAALKERQDYGLIKLTPAHLRYMQSEIDAELLKRFEATLVIGGEALYEEDLAFWKANAPRMRFINEYGATETSVANTIYEVGDELPETACLPVGKAISGSQMYVLDGDMKPLPVGVVGEIYLSGNQLAVGYLYQPELTAERFPPHPYRPGERIYKTRDYGRLMVDGNVEFLGRIDNQVKIRGYRVELGEIESVLNTYEGIRECVVVVNERSEQKRLVAYYVSTKKSLSKEELDHYLGKELPSYMIPSFYVELSTLPLTVNGKVDTKALPEFEIEIDEDRYVEPRSDEEKALTGIWCAVLKLEKVGIHDNFFGLGGDSILSIQVISKARDLELHLTPRDIFESPNIAELALKVKREGLEIDQGLAEGEVPLTPIQQWFFEEGFANPHHFNQAFLFRIKERLDVRALKKALAAVIKHHDSLRLRYRKTDAGWKQYYATDKNVYEVPIEGGDIRGVVNESEAIKAQCTQWQSALDINRGPILKVGIIQGHHDGCERLLIAIHHLVIDSVSWRILLPDLQKAYEQAIAGNEIQFSSKSHSFKTWSEKLIEYANSAAIQKDKDYWLGVGRDVNYLPVDHEQDYWYAKNMGHCHFELGAHETADLLQRTHQAYNTQINDLLLSALLKSVAKWNGERDLLFHLEGHGREEIIEGLDVSRTLGWFTNLYPVQLELLEKTKLGNIIKSVKEQLRKIPNKGMSYGVLRYCSGDDPLKEKLATHDKAQITFNYLGQIDQNISNIGMWETTSESYGKSSANENHYPDLLSIVGKVSQNKLQFRLSYSKDHYDKETTEKLGGSYLEAIKEVIDHCIKLHDTVYTPSDFENIDITQEQLDGLLLRKNKSIESIYNVSSLQTGFLFHALHSPDSDQYVVQSRRHYHGVLDVKAFKRAWQKLIERHSILRTRFVWAGLREPVQVVEKQVGLPWHEEDWRGLTDEEQISKWEKYYQEDLSLGFDLSKPCLMRLHLIQVGEKDYRFIWTHHHIILDGWSLPLLFKELDEAYESYKRGELPSFGVVPKYERYINWVRKQDKTEIESFWRQKLSRTNSPTDITIRKSGVQLDPNKPIDDLKREELELDNLLTEELSSFAKKHGVTLNTLVQLVWAKVLSVYSNQDRVMYGTTISGRSHQLPDIDKMIGLFINTLPMNVDLSGNKSVSDCLQELHKQIQETNHYSYASLSEIQKWSDFNNGIPLFNSLYVFENYPSRKKDDQDRDLVIKELGGQSKASYSLIVLVLPGERLKLRVMYDGACFESRAMKHLLEHIKEGVRWILVNPRSKLKAMDVVPFEEKYLMLEQWNSDDLDYIYELTVSEILEEHIAKYVDRTALVYCDTKISYRELAEYSDNVAKVLNDYFASHSFNVNKRVAIYANRGWEVIVYMLGTLKVGATYIPLDPTYPEERLKYIIQDACPDCILVTDIGDTKLDYIRTKSAADIISSAYKHSSINSFEYKPLNPNDIAYIIYTSGSTGEPKGVVISHLSLCNLIRNQISLLKIEHKSRVLQFSSICFDASVWEIFATLAAGASLYIAPDAIRTNPNLLYSYLKNNNITHLTLVPTMLHSLPKGKLTSLRTLINCGDVCDAITINYWAKDRMFINAYGLTEGTVCSSLLYYRDSYTSNNIGKPISNVKLYILDDHMRYVPIGVSGELYISGPSLAVGYLNKEKLTQERFLDNPYFDPNTMSVEYNRLYKTGDLSRWCYDGTIEFLGRSDNQVKMRGFRIELSEIEAQIRKHFNVRNCTVRVFKDNCGEYLVAYIISSLGIEHISLSDVRVELSKILPAYMLPSVVYSLEAFPLLPNGKINDKLLPDPAERADGEGASTDLLMDSIEYRLLKIWNTVLPNEVDLHSNFFNVGGDSLLALHLTVQINKEFNLSLPVSWVFMHQAIIEQARDIKTRNNQESFYNPVVKFNENKKTKLFLIHPGMGTAYVYSTLAKLLAAKQSCYGVDYFNLNYQTDLLFNIEAMAKKYIEFVEKSANGAPYVLGGWSLGGVIAYEMALQLQSLNKSVETIYLIDSMAFNAIERKVFARVDMVDLHQMVCSNLRLKNDSPEFIKKYERTMTIELSAISKYEIKPYNGKVILFKPMEELDKQSVNPVIQKIINNKFKDPLNGWNNFVSNISAIKIEGNHFTMMTDYNNVKTIANYFND